MNLDTSQPSVKVSTLKRQLATFLFISAVAAQEKEKSAAAR
jgi:hypothetical protein